MNSSIQVIARGIISDPNNRILLCRMIDATWWFLPGGHVEIGEDSRTALLREIKEECDAKINDNAEFYSVIENTFPCDNNITHEINILFLLKGHQTTSIQSKKPHLEFSYFTKQEIKNLKILPQSINNMVHDYLDNNSPTPFVGLNDV